MNDEQLLRALMRMQSTLDRLQARLAPVGVKTTEIVLDSTKLKGATFTPGQGFIYPDVYTVTGATLNSINLSIQTGIINLYWGDPPQLRNADPRAWPVPNLQFSATANPLPYPVGPQQYDHFRLGIDVNSQTIPQGRFYFTNY